jgi:hypothetical protein
VTLARSAIHPSTTVEVLFPEEQDMKPLNLADTYDSTYDDEEPTVKINMAAVLPKVHVEKSYPGVGLAIVFIGGGLFWLMVYFLVFG